MPSVSADEQSFSLRISGPLCFGWAEYTAGWVWEATPSIGYGTLHLLCLLLYFTKLNGVVQVEDTQLCTWKLQSWFYTWNLFLVLQHSQHKFVLFLWTGWNSHSRLVALGGSFLMENLCHWLRPWAKLQTGEILRWRSKLKHLIYSCSAESENESLSFWSKIMGRSGGLLWRWRKAHAQPECTGLQLACLISSAEVLRNYSTSLKPEEIAV